MIYGKLPIVFLSTIASEKKDTINSQIASYLIDHLHSVQSMGIREMAAACMVSVSSISRFCKEIGLRDFAELRELLFSTRFSFEESLSAEESDWFSAYSHQVQGSIAEVANTVNRETLISLCRAIHDSERTAVFGLLKSGAVAFNLQSDLLMLGKAAYSNISYAQQIQYILESREDDVIVIFSYTGSYFDCSERNVFWAKKPKGKIWLISGAPISPPSFVERVVFFRSKQDQNSHPYQLQFLAGLIAQQYCRLYS